MPKYRITDPETGRVVTISGDSPPTQADADAIFQSVNTQKPTPKGNALTNFVPSVINNAVDIGSGLINVLNPDMEKNTVANVGKLGVGAVQKLIPGEQGFEGRADAVGQFYKDRYGGADNIMNTVNQDPAGVLLDLSTLLTGGAGLASKTGLVNKSSKVASIASKANTVGKALDPVESLLTGAQTLRKGTKAGTGKVLDAVENEAKQIPMGGLRVTDNQKEAFRTKHKTAMDDFVRDEGLSGNPRELADEKVDALQSEYESLVSRDDVYVSKSEMKSAFDKQIAEYEQGTYKMIPEAKALADKLKKDRDFVLANFPDDKITTKQLIELRRKTDELIKPNQFMADSLTANKNVTMYRIYNDALYSKFPDADARAMGQRLGKYYDFLEYTKKTDTPRGRSRLRDAFWGGSVAMGAINPGAIPGLLLAELVRRGASNPTILGGVSKGLEASAQGARKASGAIDSQMEALLRVAQNVNKKGRDTGARQVLRDNDQP